MPHPLGSSSLETVSSWFIFFFFFDTDVSIPCGGGEGGDRPDTMETPEVALGHKIDRSCLRRRVRMFQISLMSRLIAIYLIILCQNYSAS